MEILEKVLDENILRFVFGNGSISFLIIGYWLLTKVAKKLDGWVDVKIKNMHMEMLPYLCARRQGIAICSEEEMKQLKETFLEMMREEKVEILEILGE